MEQAIIFHVNAWDANCPQHIPRLIHAERIEHAFELLRRRVRYLEATLDDAGIAFTPEEEPRA